MLVKPGERLALERSQLRTIGNATGNGVGNNGRMKTQTENRHLTRIERAARLLEERLDAPPDSSQLAHAVGLSRFHFARIYRAATGESVLETLQRLRACRSLELLADGVPVTEIAHSVGYETPQAFSRAFRQWTGLAPREARGRAAELVDRFRRPAQPAVAPLDVEVTSLQPMRLAVIRTRRPFGPLNDVYEALFAAAEQQGKLPALQGIYGLPENDPLSDSDGIEQHVAAVRLADEALDGFETLEVGPANALRVRHTGPFEAIDSTSIAAYRYLIDHELEPADVPALHHHLDDPEEVSADRLRTDLYLPLTTLSEEVDE